MQKHPSHPSVRRVLLIALALLAATSRAWAASSIAAWIMSSPNDLTGLTTLSGNDVVANATLPFTLTIDGVGFTTVAI